MSQTIFDALRVDHDRQRTMVDLLVETHGDSELRAELIGRLDTELRSHAAAEEQYFYRQLMADDMTLEKSRHAVAEHHQLDELLDRLASTDPSSSAWLSTAKKLREKVLHHLQDEEHGIFQLAGKVLDEKQKTELAQSFSEAKAKFVDEYAD